MSVGSMKANRRFSSSPDNLCSVCLGDIKDKSYIPGCYHTFCFVCIKEWASRNNVCPLCKGSFDRIIHKVKSDTNFKEYIIKVTKRPDSHENYPFFFPENPFNDHTSFFSGLLRNSVHFEIVTPSRNISTSSLFDETRVLQAGAPRTRSNRVLSPLSFNSSRFTRRPLHMVMSIDESDTDRLTRRPLHVTVISEDESDTNIIENIQETKVINSEKKPIDLNETTVTSTSTDLPTPSTSGNQKVSSSIQKVIIIDDSDTDDSDDLNHDKSVVFVQRSTSKKGKSSSKCKKKSDYKQESAEKQENDQQEKQTEIGNEYEGDVEEEDSKRNKKERSKHMKKKSTINLKNLPKSKHEESDNDDLEVIEIMSRKPAREVINASTSTSRSPGDDDDVTICGEFKMNDDVGADNDCVYIMSKQNKKIKGNIKKSYIKKNVFVDAKNEDCDNIESNGIKIGDNICNSNIDADCLPVSTKNEEESFVNLNVTNPNKENNNNEEEDTINEEENANSEDMNANSEGVKDNTENVNDNTEDLSDNTDDLSYNTDDLSYNTDDLNDNTDDLNDNTDDLNDNTDDLNDNTEGFNVNTEDFNENTVDENDNTEDVNDNSEDVNDNENNINEENTNKDEKERNDVIEENSDDEEKKSNADIINSNELNYNGDKNNDDSNDNEEEIKGKNEDLEDNEGMEIEEKLDNENNEVTSYSINDNSTEHTTNVFKYSINKEKPTVDKNSKKQLKRTCNFIDLNNKKGKILKE